jgi:hypothetical protein
MSGRGVISWKTRTSEGERREVYAKRIGRAWNFHERVGRFEEWQPVPDPTLEDWLELLNGVQRRVPRRLMPPDEPKRVRRLIQRQYPEAKV